MKFPIGKRCCCTDELEDEDIKKVRQHVGNMRYEGKIREYEDRSRMVIKGI